MATLGDTSIPAGETVQVALRVENVGGRDGTFEADLLVDGETVASESVTVEAGGTESVVLEQRFDEPGQYEISVGETSLGTVTVTAATDARTAKRAGGDGEAGEPIEVVGATVPADWVMEGFETTVRATVVNTANRTANRTLTVTIDDQPVANETVTLQPNERDVVEIAFEAVSGNVAVEGVDAGRIEVGERSGGVETETKGSTGGDGWEGELGRTVLLVGVVIILAGVVLLGGATVRVVGRDR